MSEEKEVKVSNKRRYVGVAVLIAIIAIGIGLTTVKVYKTPSGGYTIFKPTPQLVLTNGSGQQVVIPIARPVRVAPVRVEKPKFKTGLYENSEGWQLSIKDDNTCSLGIFKGIWYLQNGSFVLQIGSKTTYCKILPNGNIIANGSIFKRKE